LASFFSSGPLFSLIKVALFGTGIFSTVPNPFGRFEGAFGRFFDLGRVVVIFGLEGSFGAGVYFRPNLIKYGCARGGIGSKMVPLADRECAGDLHTPTVCVGECGLTGRLLILLEIELKIDNTVKLSEDKRRFTPIFLGQHFGFLRNNERGRARAV